MTLTDLPTRTEELAPDEARTEARTDARTEARTDERTEALIREARQHQRRRHYLIAAVITALVALVVAALLAIGMGSGAPSGSPVHAADGTLVSSQSHGVVTIRPVDCFAPPYTSEAPASPRPLPTGCPAQYRVNDVIANSSVHGFSDNAGTSDPALGAYPNTRGPGRIPNQVVLLGSVGPKSAAGDGQRYLLGPAQFVMTPHSDVASATVIRSPIGTLEVKIVLTPAGAEKWNAAAKADFHQQLAYVLDGKVFFVPIIEPGVSSFARFGRESVISGGALTATEVHQLAAAL